MRGVRKLRPHSRTLQGDSCLYIQLAGCIGEVCSLSSLPPFRGGRSGLYQLESLYACAFRDPSRSTAQQQKTSDPTLRIGVRQCF